MNDMALRATCLSVVFAWLTSGHMICPTCVPLKDLLAPGYGISISVGGLSSAVAFHNGTLSNLASMAGSEEYRNLLSSTFEQHDSYEPISTTLRCRARKWKGEPEPESWREGLLKLLRSQAGHWIGKVKETFDPFNIAEATTPLDPPTHVIQEQLLALEPFASMGVDALSQVTVAIQIPAWLIPSPYACSFREAAESTFGRVVGLESASSSAYTALGHELCRVSRDAFECDGPGRLAVFEYDGQFATASVIKTPVDLFDRLHTTYSTLSSHDAAELSRWINAFLDATSPDMITLAGSDVDSTTFQKALGQSKVAGQLVPGNPVIDAKDMKVKGAAQAAKDDLENHVTDCSEDPDCYDIRKEADNIAGQYSFHRPKAWPAVNDRHWREDEDANEYSYTPGSMPSIGHMISPEYVTVDGDDDRLKVQS